MLARIRLEGGKTIGRRAMYTRDRVRRSSGEKRMLEEGGREQLGLGGATKTSDTGVSQNGKKGRRSERKGRKIVHERR